MAENIDVNVNVNTSQAQQSLTNLNNRLGALSGSFATLSTALASLGFGALITDAMRFADSIQDINDATGIATSTILGFGSAVQASGGDFEKAQTGLLRLVEQIGEAREGNKTAIASFEKVGLSLNSLKNLSEQEILRKTINGLASISDTSRRSAAQVDLLGKALRGVDLQNVQRSIEISIRTNQQYESSIKAAADANESLEKMNNRLRLELLKFLEPVNRLIAKIDANSASFLRWYDAITTVIKVLFFIVTVVVPVIRLLRAFAAAMIAIKEAAVLIGTTGANSIRTFFTAILTWGKKAKDGLKTTADEVTRASRELADAATTPIRKSQLLDHLKDLASQSEKLKGVISAIELMRKRLAEFGVALGVLGTGAWAYFTSDAKRAQEAVDALTQSTLDYHRAVREAGTQPIRTGESQAAPSGYSNLRDYFTQEREKRAQAMASSTEALTNRLQDLVNEIKNVNKVFKENNKITLNNILTETAYLNMSNDQIELARVQQTIYDDAMRSIEDLTKIKESLVGAERSLIPVIDQQIKKIIEQKNIDQARATQAVTNLQNIRNAQEDFRKSLEDINRAFNQQEALTQLQEELDLIGLIGDELDVQNGLININRDLRSQMMDLSLQMMQLDEERARLGEEQYNKERQRIIQQMLDVQMLSDARKAALLEEIALRKRAEDSYLEGTKRAMTDIAESFKPVNMAQETIRQGWGKMSNALDEFVETGKLNFADLARSIIQDITKMILKMLVFKAIEAGLNAIFPGLGTAVSAVGGRANGGPVNKNMPYMVGERGPELFVPQNNGKIVPNNQLKADSTRPMPTNNIYNNYYINALDAKSVAQMFAENRKAIFGANKMAEREMSYSGVR